MFGGECIRAQFDGNWVQNNGYYTFNATLTGQYVNGTRMAVRSGLADLLLGFPSAAAGATGNSTGAFREWQVDGHLQDNWQLNPALTLNIGCATTLTIRRMIKKEILVFTICAGTIPQTLALHMPDVYAEEFNLAAQHSFSQKVLTSLAYVGETGKHSSVRVNANQLIAAPAGSTILSIRPYSYAGDVFG